MKSILTVENLSKMYVLGSEVDFSLSFREMLSGLVMAPIRRFRRLKGKQDAIDPFWALKDISFEIGAGEIIGVIGSNGAGKSTLLKVLSRITPPTKGEINYHGRMASLLEVGTGFHPELTGRENIYLNGSILGMSRQEIDSRFDKIVSFANVEKFLETPVKRYSSGMYVRLAFSVAAHVDPDILIIDEVLAVGDAEFQKKCLELMRKLSLSGRTVIFVSHNMDSIRALTSRCILLEGGRLQMDGAPQDVIDCYLKRNTSDIGVVQEDKKLIEVSDFSASIYQTDSQLCEIKVRIKFRANEDISRMKIDFAIQNEDGVRVIQHVCSADQTISKIVTGDIIDAHYVTNITNLLHGDYFGLLYIYNNTQGPILHIENSKLFNLPNNPADIYANTFTPILVPKLEATIKIL